MELKTIFNSIVIVSISVIVLFVVGIILLLIGSVVGKRVSDDKKNLYKKFKKAGGYICGILLATFVVFIITFKILVSTSYVEEKTNDVVNKVTDESVKNKVDTYVNELIREGVINESQIEDYLKAKNGTDSIGIEDDDKNQKNDTPNGSENSVDNKNSNSKLPNGIVNSQGDKANIIQKLLKAMTPEDLALARNLASKADVSYVMSIATTNPAEAKKYLKEHYTSAEISAGINLYGKYAYLLN